jgi:hypothetical protein
VASTSGYPKIPAKNWRILRAKAASAPSTKFTPSLVATLTGMNSPESAMSNIIRPMRALGLFNEDGTLTDRGNKWRVDASYPAACDEILKEVYPSELASLTDGDNAPDQGQVIGWFEHEGYGKSNANQMGALYTLIASKETPEPPASSDKKAERAPKAPSKTKTTGTPSSTPDPPHTPEPPRGSPNIHLDIQVHIPSDATPEQIDQIFASMAKHLYQK